MSYDGDGGGWGAPANQDDYFPNNFDAQFAGRFGVNDEGDSAGHDAARSLTSFTSRESKISRGAMSAPAIANADDYFLEKKKKSSKKASKKSSKREHTTVQESSGDGVFDDDFRQHQHTGRKNPHEHAGDWEQYPSDRNRGANKAENWDAFATQSTGKTRSTRSSFDSNGIHAPPFATIHVDHSADDVSRMPDPTEHMASFHGEMLQNFLQKSGQDDKMALQTAMAFESFLKIQSQNKHTPSHKPESQIDDDEETRMEQMESLALDDDTFAPDTNWDNGTFVDPTAYDRLKYRDPRNLDGSHIDSMASRRPRNLVALTQVRAARPPPLPGTRTDSSLEDRSIASRESANSRGEVSRGAMSLNSRNSQGIRLSDHSRTSHASQGMGGPPSHLPRPRFPRSFDEQLMSLPSPHRITVSTLKRNWEQGGHGGFPDAWYLRFARCSPGMPYDYKAAWSVMKKFDRRYMKLDVAGMEYYLKSKIIFPCRGLKNKFGQSMFYMQARRFSPNEAPVDAVIENLVYVMNCMMEDEQQCSRGIGFIIDLSDCKMHHFGVGYFHKLMMAVQGRKLPTRVEMFLLVNQPSWFANMWGAVIKPMLHKDFREKTQRINFHDLKKFLAPDSEQFLPTEIYSGKASSDLIVKSFIDERKFLEADRFY